MTTIVLVIIGVLAVLLGVFSWRFENCGTTPTPKTDVMQQDKDTKEEAETGSVVK